MTPPHPPPACSLRRLASDLENVQRAIKARSSKSSHAPLATHSGVPSEGEGAGRRLQVLVSAERGGPVRAGEALLWPPFKESLRRASDAAGVRKWEWTGSAGSSSGKRLLIKLREPPRKFFKSKNRTSQIKAPSAHCSLCSQTLMQKTVLFAAIATPLYLPVIERRNICQGRGLGHSVSSKVAPRLCDF